MNYVYNRFMVYGQSSRVISVGYGAEDDYASIQGAVNAAEPGDTINVKAGVYYENVVVNKSVWLFGEDKESTVVDGCGEGHVVFVEASNVTVSGFTLRNSGVGYLNPFSGIRLNFSDCCLISNNVILDNEYGVWLSDSNNNTFVGNFVMNNSGTYGVRLYGSKNNTVINNVVVDNGYGIYLFGGSDANIIRYNNASGNSFGVFLRSCDGNLVEGNTVVDSSMYGITLGWSSNNFVFHNNFVNNHWQVDVYESFGSVWHDGYPSGGNYWSDYFGVDEFCGVGQNLSGSDGLGDTAYGYDVDNVDMYPLMGFFNVFDVVWNGTSYSILTVCNSTITGFSLTRLETSVEISLNVSDGEGTFGFCRVSVPKVFLEGLDDGYVVVVNGNSSISVRELESYGEYDVLYFAYVHGPFISEFTSVFLMLLFLFFTFVILFVRERANLRQM